MNRFAAVLLLTFAPLAGAQDKKAPNELAGYRTVATALTTKIAKSAANSAGQTGFLGLYVVESSGRVLVEQVQPDSPAAKAGFETGDQLDQFAGLPVKNAATFREALLTKAPGDAIEIRVLRKGKPQTVMATLGAVSRPMQISGQRAILGVQVDEGPGGEGIVLKSITPDLPAAKAGLKAGEIVTKVNGAKVASSASLADALAGKKPGDVVPLLVRRAGKDVELKLTLTGDTGGGGPSAGWDTRTATLFKKNVYRLAVVPIEFPDVKHNDKITGQSWDEALFSAKKYLDKSVTGQRVYGSVNDYYQEQSFGKLRVEGKVFAFVEASKKRADYGQSTNQVQKTALLGEVLDKLLERDGKDALAGFDGIFFLYAGGRVQTNRGGLYWPHRASFRHQGKQWAYFITSEGGGAMSTISVICHEFGHMLGLPDLYARPENPGSEGVGVWCAMSNQVGNGRPQHFGAWSKERLGWIDPVLIDPTVKQKLILAPIENSPKECIKVLAKLDGSEYFLLENRRKKGFDQELPAEGLLIWRVVQNKPILEEAHGVEGPAGPRVHLGAVPFPSPANNAFTPYTVPSSRTQLGGGLPVWITNIRRLPDGRITLWIGYEFF